MNYIAIIVFTVAALAVGNPPAVTKAQKQDKCFTGHDVANFYLGD